MRESVAYRSEKSSKGFRKAYASIYRDDIPLEDGHPNWVYQQSFGKFVCDSKDEDEDEDEDEG